MGIFKVNSRSLLTISGLKKETFRKKLEKVLIPMFTPPTYGKMAIILVVGQSEHVHLASKVYINQRPEKTVYWTLRLHVVFMLSI